MAVKVLPIDLQDIYNRYISIGNDNVHFRTLHDKQREFVESDAQRKIIRAGRRSGKTVGVANYAVKRFLSGHRILYGVPMQDQVERFWYECKLALGDAIESGKYYKNETMHVIEVPDTLNRIRAKTCWNADTLRGDYGDDLILDEFQLMDEDVWGQVGVPMLLDNRGRATFIYTPPSLASRSVSKARDPRHAAKMFKHAEEDITGRWAAFHFTSHDNPYISTQALEEITQDMTSLAYRQEIMAEDIDEVPGALFKRAWIDDHRVQPADVPNLQRIVIPIDPATTSTKNSDETGIAVTALGIDNEYYVLSCKGYRVSPDAWARIAIGYYEAYHADRIIAESNQGGDMVESTIRQVSRDVSLKLIHVFRGKTLRAEPVAAMYEQGRVHHVGELPELEDQMLSFPMGTNDDMVDATVYGILELSGHNIEIESEGFIGNYN